MINFSLGLDNLFFHILIFFINFFQCFSLDHQLFLFPFAAFVLFLNFFKLLNGCFILCNFYSFFYEGQFLHLIYFINNLLLLLFTYLMQFFKSLYLLWNDVVTRWVQWKLLGKIFLRLQRRANFFIGLFHDLFLFFLLMLMLSLNFIEFQHEFFIFCCFLCLFHHWLFLELLNLMHEIFLFLHILLMDILQCLTFLRKGIISWGVQA